MSSFVELIVKLQIEMLTGYSYTCLRICVWLSYYKQYLGFSFMEIQDQVLNNGKSYISHTNTHKEHCYIVFLFSLLNPSLTWVPECFRRENLTALFCRLSGAQVKTFIVTWVAKDHSYTVSWILAGISLIKNLF